MKWGGPPTEGTHHVAISLQIHDRVNSTVDQDQYRFDLSSYCCSCQRQQDSCRWHKQDGGSFLWPRLLVLYLPCGGRCSEEAWGLHQVAWGGSLCLATQSAEYTNAQFQALLGLYENLGEVYSLLWSETRLLQQWWELKLHDVIILRCMMITSPISKNM